MIARRHTHTVGTVKRKGFTIIQLVIGMLIFAILTGVAFFGISIYTAQANETRVASDLGTFEVAIKDYMLNNLGACSDGALSPVGLNHYLTKENTLTSDTDDDDIGSEVSVSAGVGGEASYKKLSTLEDPWGHQYRVVIRNNADRQAGDSDLGGKGTDRAFIYVYSMGKDGKGAAEDTKQDDSVLVVQYSDGEVFSKVYLPSDSKNQSVSKPAYTAWNKNDSGNHSVMNEAIFAVGAVDPSTTPGGGGGTGGGSVTPGDDDTKPGDLIPTGAVYTVRGLTSSPGEQLVGDGVNVFPDAPQKYDLYQEGNYVYGYCVGEFPVGGGKVDFGTDWNVVSITTFMVRFQGLSADDAPQLQDYGKIRSAIAGKPITNMAGAFEGCTDLTTAPNIPGSVTNMTGTFYECTSLAAAPTIPNGVTNMMNAFRGCTSLVSAPTIPDSTTDMWNTFSGCVSLITAPKIPGNVTDMYGTFNGCTSLATAPDMSKASSVTDMDWTFYNCAALATAPVIPNSVVSMEGTFSNCSALTADPAIPGNVVNMEATFQECTSLVTAPDMSRANSVTNMSLTFIRCAALTTAPVIPSSVTNISSAFAGCTSLTVAPDMSKASNVVDMSGTFQHCTALATVPVIPASVTDMSWAFDDCTSLIGQTIKIPRSVTSTAGIVAADGMSGTWEGGPSWFKQ